MLRVTSSSGVVYGCYHRALRDDAWGLPTITISTYIKENFIVFVHVSNWTIVKMYIIIIYVRLFSIAFGFLDTLYSDTSNAPNEAYGMSNKS